MQSWRSSQKRSSRAHRSRQQRESPLAIACLQLVDVSLLGVIFLAPLFFGGRHLLGRFVLIALTSIAAIAWCVYQTLSGSNRRARSFALFVGLAAILLVTFQLTPLSSELLQRLAPRNASLLTMWGGEIRPDLSLGEWTTLSLAPSTTKIALATVIAYVLLFITTVERLRTVSDIKRLLRYVAVAVIFMAGFGILQYFTSNGLFFWFYEYPYNTTIRAAKGSFTTRNHFAHFIALGSGPLLAWITLRLRARREGRTAEQDERRWLLQHIALHAGLGLAVLAVLLSLSRGGVTALATACSLAVIVYCYRGLLSSSYCYGFAMLGLLVVGALSLSDYDLVASRLDDLTSASIETLDNKAGRRNIWSANVSSIEQGSLFGSGVGTHREIYPIYYPTSQTKEFTHAENGYLQIGTETGFVGLALLGITILLVLSWCWQAIRHATSETTLMLATAVAASLIASLVHSLVDFVWFIPACMSLTIMLAACALRLAQLTTAEQCDQADSSTVPHRLRAFGLLHTGVVTCGAVWAVLATVGPASSALHWDKYLLSSAQHAEQISEQLWSGEAVEIDNEFEIARTEAMVYRLTEIVGSHPESARAHLRLASKYLHLFNLRQQQTDNAMSVDQVRDAAMASRFPTSEALQQWLVKAFAGNSKLLYRAHYHATKALQLCPLQGDGYVYLAKLCFLRGQGSEALDTYLQQALQVRPHDGDVVFEVGRQRLLKGDVDGALELWQSIYTDAGSHQSRIIRLLAGQMPAEAFIKLFQPDWTTMRQVWRSFYPVSTEHDLQQFLQYAEAVAERQTQQLDSKQAAHVWHVLSTMQLQLQHPQASLASSERAYQLDPTYYPARRALAHALVVAGRYQEAQPHLRWCLARKPDNLGLRNELIEATKVRLPNTASNPRRLQHQ